VTTGLGPAQAKHTNGPRMRSGGRSLTQTPLPTNGSELVCVVSR
jgi:hypothetical protein